MRSTTSFLIYATFLALLSTFTAAWPWPSFFPEIDSLVVRANDAGTLSISWSGKMLTKSQNQARKLLQPVPKPIAKQRRQPALAKIKQPLPLEQKDLRPPNLPNPRLIRRTTSVWQLAV